MGRGFGPSSFFMEKKILLDIDGVLADFILGFTTLLSKHREDITPYNTYEQRQWDFAYPKEVTRQGWTLVDESLGRFWSTLPVLATADEKQLVRDLSQQHEVYFVTSRPGGRLTRVATENWLVNNFGLHNPSVILCNEKGAFVDAAAIDFALDDKPENVATMDTAGTKAYMLTRRYNKDARYGSRDFDRVASIQEFVNVVNRG